MNQEFYIYCSSRGSTAFPEYCKRRQAEIMRILSEDPSGDIPQPLVLRSVTIKGLYSHVYENAPLTKHGVLTEVSKEELEFLKTQPNFNTAIEKLFITVFNEPQPTLEKPQRRSLQLPTKIPFQNVGRKKQHEDTLTAFYDIPFDQIANIPPYAHLLEARFECHKEYLAEKGFDDLNAPYLVVDNKVVKWNKEVGRDKRGLHLWEAIEECSPERSTEYLAALFTYTYCRFKLNLLYFQFNYRIDSKAIALLTNILSDLCMLNQLHFNIQIREELLARYAAGYAKGYNEATAAKSEKSTLWKERAKPIYISLINKGKTKKCAAKITSEKLNEQFSHSDEVSDVPEAATIRKWAYSLAWEKNM